MTVRVLPAITLWQPWASLVAIGAKPYETRGKPPPRRLLGQRVAIHAAGRACFIALEPTVMRDISRAFGFDDWNRRLPRGAVVCTAIIAEGIAAEQVRADSFGDYTPGRWAWRLDDIRPIQPPVPAKGQQSWGWLWPVPEEAAV